MPSRFPYASIEVGQYFYLPEELKKNVRILIIQAQNRGLLDDNREFEIKPYKPGLYYCLRTR